MRDREHEDTRILYRIPIKSHSEAARKRLGVERSKQNWLPGSIYCLATIADANNREWYEANLLVWAARCAIAIVIHVSPSCIGTSLRIELRANVVR